MTFKILAKSLGASVYVELASESVKFGTLKIPAKDWPAIRKIFGGGAVSASQEGIDVVLVESD